MRHFLPYKGKRSWSVTKRHWTEDSACAKASQERLLANKNDHFYSITHRPTGSLHVFTRMKICRIFLELMQNI